MNNYDAFRAGMLRAALMVRDEFKRAPEASKGEDCVWMGGYESACDHLSVVIANAAVIDSVRIAAAQPDWQYHISLLLPDGIKDEALLKIYQVVEHELRQAAITQSSDQVARAAEEIVEKTKCNEYRGGPHRTIMAADAVAAIISRYLRTAAVPEPAGDRCTCNHCCPSQYERETEEAQCVHADWCALMVTPALVDEVQRRMDQVVEAAVEWHQAGREGAEWFEAAERLGAAIDSLLELRSAPVATAVTEE